MLRSQCLLCSKYQPQQLSPVKPWNQLANYHTAPVVAVQDEQHTIVFVAMDFFPIDTNMESKQTWKLPGDSTMKHSCKRKHQGCLVGPLSCIPYTVFRTSKHCNLYQGLSDRLQTCTHCRLAIMHEVQRFSLLCLCAAQMQAYHNPSTKHILLPYEVTLGKTLIAPTPSCKIQSPQFDTVLCSYTATSSDSQSKIQQWHPVQTPCFFHQLCHKP